MPYTPILATLAYVFSPDRSRVLMVHRTARPGDDHAGKYNGLGGKLERGEDVLSGIRRELREEAGIECQSIRLAGTVNWPGFGKSGEDWFGFVFRVTAFTGEVPASNAEGTLHWVEVGRVMELTLWPGDRLFLPMVLDLGHAVFHTVMPYADGEVAGFGVELEG